MKRRDLIFFLILSVILFGTMFSLNVWAEDAADDEISENEAEIAEYERKKELQEQKLANAENEYEKMLEDNKTLIEDYQKIKDDIDKINKEVKKMDEKLAKDEERLNNTMKVLKKTVATMYVKSKCHYHLDLIFSQENLDNFIDTLFWNDYVTTQQNKFLSSCKQDIQLLKDNKNLQDELKIAFEIKRDALSDDKKEFDSQEAEIKDLIEKNEATISYYIRQQEILEEQSNQIREYLANNENNAGEYVGGTMVWPCKGYVRVSSGYGMRTLNGVTKMHKGIDIAANYGVSIEAANSGTILTKVVSSTGYGIYIIIGHGGGIATLYAHCSWISDKAIGSSVKKGETIARIGSTGNSTGNHVHFEVREFGVQVNPFNYVSEP